MADWYLNRALTNFRNAVNSAYPNRDKASDGTVGDPAHQASSSDHNPDLDGSVDAWDMDVDLRSGNDAKAIEELKQVFQRHPAGRYWIHNRQIAERKNGWRRDKYTGSNPHDKHIHWNSEPTQENSTVPWVIKEVDLDSAQDARLRNVETATKSIEAKVNYLFDLGSRSRAGMPTMSDGKTVIVQTDWRIRDEAWQKKVNEDIAALKAASVIITDEQLERVLRKVIFGSAA